MNLTARRITATTSALAAALALGACGPNSGPLEHGTVKDKRHQAERVTPTYRDTYRETNCRNISASAFTLGVSRPTTTGGSGGRSSTTGGRSSTTGGTTKVKPAQPNSKNLDKGTSGGNSAGGATGGGNTTRRHCDREYTGREQTGTQRHPAVWEVLIQDGRRSNWKRVDKDTWDHIKPGDKI
ncbi:hypothetical protein [Streptomyces sp. NPDC055912]|uniref:hypothetical protein n=1 Tax=Streptomyces sp. NPDC055912 TaxID=3345660 RepID=UPI0035E18B8D